MNWKEEFNTQFNFINDGYISDVDGGKKKLYDVKEFISTQFEKLIEDILDYLEQQEDANGMPYGPDLKQQLKDKWL